MPPDFMVFFFCAVVKRQPAAAKRNRYDPPMGNALPASVGKRTPAKGLTTVKGVL